MIDRAGVRGAHIASIAVVVLALVVVIVGTVAVTHWTAEAAALRANASVRVAEMWEDAARRHRREPRVYIDGVRAVCLEGPARTWTCRDPGVK